MNWLKRMRGALGMGLTWAVAWAGFGIMVGVTSLFTPFLPWDAFFAFYDAPLPTLAIPGFIGGALFSTVLGIAGRRRRFEELSHAKVGMWGALGGLVLSCVPLLLLSDSTLGIWAVTAIISGPLTVLCAASAMGSLAIARKAERRELLGAGVHIGELREVKREPSGLLR